MYRTHRNPRTTLAPITTDRVSSRLINAVQSHYVTLTLRGTLTIAGGAATAIRNRGSIWAAVREVGISENGKDRVLVTGNVLRFMSEMAAPSALSASRVTSTAAAAYTLEESARIYFAHPFAAVPRETSFLERDSKQVLEVFMKLAGTPADGGGSALVNVGGAVTGILSAVTCTVEHGYDATETARPYFIPTMRQIVQPVAAATSKLETFIKTSNALRGMVVTQETTTDGEVADIINALDLRGDFGSLIGDSQAKWADLLLASEFEFGGAVVSTIRAHLGLNFQEHGRLSSILNPNQDNNLRFEFDCQPSVAGAGSSQIRITLLELERDSAVVDPELPIPV